MDGDCDNLQVDSPKKSFWERYEGVFGETLFFPRAFEKKIVLDWLKPEMRNKILDIGCGPGAFHGTLKRNCILYGIDIDKKSLMAAKAKHDCEYFLVDGTRLPFRDEVFDKVFSNCVFEHIDDDESVLKEINRTLKHGGICILTVECGEAPRQDLKAFKAIFNDKIKKSYEKYGKDGLVKHYEKVFAVKRFYSIKELKKKVNNANLEVVEFKYYIKGVNKLFFDWGVSIKYFGFFGRASRIIAPFIYPIIYLHDRLAAGKGYGLAVLIRKLI